MHVLATSVLAVAVLGAAALGMPSSAEHSGELGEDMPGFEAVRDACIKELGLEDEMKGDKPDPHLKVKYCMLKKDGVIGKDGKFSVDGTIAHATRILKMHPEKLEDVKEAAAKCQKQLATETAKEGALAEKVLACLRGEKHHETTSAKTM